jgi:cytochrome c553
MLATHHQNNRGTGQLLAVPMTIWKRPLPSIVLAMIGTILFLAAVSALAKKHYGVEVESILTACVACHRRNRTAAADDDDDEKVSLFASSSASSETSRCRRRW